MKETNLFMCTAARAIWSAYWLDRDNFILEEAFSFSLSPKDRRDIRKIIYEHFEYIEQQWDEFQRRRQQ
jgi:hypothetical protein